MTDMTQNKTAAPMNYNNMDQKDGSSDQANMVNKEIKKTWPELSEDDVKSYVTKPDQFFMQLKKVCHVEKADAEKQISEFKKVASDTSINNKSNNSGKSTNAA